MLLGGAVFEPRNLVCLLAAHAGVVELSRDLNCFARPDVVSVRALARRQNSVMSDSAASTPQPSKKNLNLDDLRPAKVPVETKLGTFFLRRARVFDWKHFESDDPVKLGRSVLRQLCSRVEDKHVSDPLADSDLDTLRPEDIDSLALVIAKSNEWSDLTLEPGIQGLGKLVEKAKERERERFAKVSQRLRESIGSDYAFLGGETLEKLKQQVAGLADFRRVAGYDRITELMRAAVPAGPQAALAASFVDRPPQRVLLARPEDSPMGRATLESAKNSREVAEKMDGLVELVGGLNQTLITEVLPAWIKQVDDNQDHAQQSLKKAERSLFWAKWALIASVAASVFLTWWQIEVTRSIDADSSRQQKRSEELLRDQLAVQRLLANQQSRDADQLRESRKQLASDTEENRKMLRESQRVPASKK